MHKIITACGLSLSAIGCLVLTFFYENAVTQISLGLGTGFFATIGCILLLNAFSDYNKKKAFWEQFMRHEFYKVVWVYYAKVENMPFGLRISENYYLYLCLQNKEKLVIAMKESEIKEAFYWTQRMLPKSTFGYSRSKEQLYEIGPDLLVNA